MHETGVNKQDALKIAWHAACNKYRRDNRSPNDLWRDIEKAWGKELIMPEVTITSKIRQNRYEDTSPLSVPELLVPAVDRSNVPSFVDRFIKHMDPAVPRLPWEAKALIWLSAYSSLWDKIWVEAQRLNIWILLLSRQGVGKSLLLQEAELLTLGARQDVGIVTSGSPEGIAEAAAVSECVLIILDEYAGTLKATKRQDSYMSSLKEQLSLLYDARRMVHKTRRQSIVMTNRPCVSMLTSTTKAAWEQWGDYDDLMTGYLSRFTVVCPDLSPEMEPEYTTLIPNRETIIEELQRHVGMIRNAQIHTAVLSTATATIKGKKILLRFPIGTWSRGLPLLREYEEKIGAYVPESLDDDSDELEGLTVRLPSKSRRIAAVLELCEEHPQMGNGELVIRESNVKLALYLTDMSRVWGGRAASWLRNSSEAKLARGIEKALKNSHCTIRDLQRTLHWNKSHEIKEQLEHVLLPSGAVHFVVSGNRQLWGPGPRKGCPVCDE
jgi:hypothetical protein